MRSGWVVKEDGVMNKVYLGDSVYIGPGRYVGELKLTTENGLPNDPSNLIFLDCSVVSSLLAYLNNWKKELSNAG